MRISLAASVSAALTTSLLIAQMPPAKPINALPYTPSLDVTAMDRTANPCVDFYKYSCGTWIKNNPIPPDQARWDVYSKLTYENELFLWGLLEEAAQPLETRTAAQRQIGDLFHACMDEPAIEKVGVTPVRPILDEISALKSKDELAAFVARRHLDSGDGGMLFGFGSNQDFADSSRVIAFAVAGGLSLPDRDYYTKDDAKSRETRDKYLDHVRAMFELLGDAPASAKAHAATVMAIETELAKASLTRVERRDPYKLYHKFTRPQLKALHPPSIGTSTSPFRANPV